LATGGHDRSFRVVDVERGQLLFESGPSVATATDRRDRVLGLAFAPDADRLWVACEDRWVRGVDLVGGAPIGEFLLGPTPGPMLVSADGGSLFVGAIWSGKLHRFATGDCSHRTSHPARHSNMLIALQRQPGGRLALSASRDGLVSLFDSDRDELTSVIHAAKGTLATACFAPDGRSVLTAESTGEVRVWPLDPLAVALRYRPSRPAVQVDDR
jgi:WD40 repeat protein